MTFGERIALKREEKGWSQRELARQAGIAHTQVADLERGTRRGAGVDVAKRLARALGTSVDWLIGTWEEDEAAVARRRLKGRPGRRASRVG